MVLAGRKNPSIPHPFPLSSRLTYPTRGESTTLLTLSRTSCPGTSEQADSWKYSGKANSEISWVCQPCTHVFPLSTDAPLCFGIARQAIPSINRHPMPDPSVRCLLLLLQKTHKHPARQSNVLKSMHNFYFQESYSWGVGGVGWGLEIFYSRNCKFKILMGSERYCKWEQQATCEAIGSGEDCNKLPKNSPSDSNPTFPFHRWINSSPKSEVICQDKTSV